MGELAASIAVEQSGCQHVLDALGREPRRRSPFGGGLCVGRGWVSGGGRCCCRALLEQVGGAEASAVGWPCTRARLDGEGDLLRIIFDRDTDRGGVGTATNGDAGFVDSLFTFTQPLGLRYSGAWEDRSTFVVTVINATGEAVTTDGSTLSSVRAIPTVEPIGIGFQQPMGVA